MKIAKVILLSILIIIVFVIINTSNLNIYHKASANFLLGYIGHMILFEEDKQ